MTTIRRRVGDKIVEREASPTRLQEIAEANQRDQKQREREIAKEEATAVLLDAPEEIGQADLLDVVRALVKYVKNDSPAHRS